MPVVVKLLRAAAALFLISSLASAADTPTKPGGNDDQAERDLLRVFAETAHPPADSTKPVQDSYNHYLEDYYKQASALRQAAVEVSRWQLFAANIVLGLFAFLVIAGIFFSGYQLWIAARLALLNAPQATGKTKAKAGATNEFGVDNTITLEVSKDKVRVQTAIIGIVVLVISGVFLLLFLNDVYKIQVVNYGSSEAQSQIRPQDTTAPSK